MESFCFSNFSSITYCLIHFTEETAAAPNAVPPKCTSQVHTYLIYFILLSKPLALHTFILFMGNSFDSQWTRYCLNASLCTALVIPSLPCPRVVCSVFLRPSAFLLGTSSKLRKEMQRAESTGASKYYRYCRCSFRYFGFGV